MDAANHSATTNVLEWAIPRLKVYTIAALAGPALLLAGTAFYTYVWPGVANHVESPAPPAPVDAPPIAPVGAPAAPGSSPPIASVVTPRITFDGAPPPPESVMVGARISDEHKRMLGMVTHVRRDERGNVASISVKIDATQQESEVPSGEVRWIWDSNPGTKATGVWVRSLAPRH